LRPGKKKKKKGGRSEPSTFGSLGEKGESTPLGKKKKRFDPFSCPGEKKEETVRTAPATEKKKRTASKSTVRLGGKRTPVTKGERKHNLGGGKRASETSPQTNSI